MRRIFFLLVAVLAVPMASRPLRSAPAEPPAAATTPTIDDLISLKRAGIAGDLARRPARGLHRARNELGR